jgi:hypothetical protein
MIGDTLDDQLQDHIRFMRELMLPAQLTGAVIGSVVLQTIEQDVAVAERALRSGDELQAVKSLEALRGWMRLSESVARIVAQGQQS